MLCVSYISMQNEQMFMLLGIKYTSNFMLLIAYTVWFQEHEILTISKLVVAQLYRLMFYTIPYPIFSVDSLLLEL